ncbi:unnamed protein product [Prunus armeniaca]
MSHQNQASKRAKTIDSFFKKKNDGDKLDNDKASTFNDKASTFNDKASPSIESPHHTSPLVEPNQFDVAFLERDPGKRIQISEYPIDQRDEVRCAYIKVGPYQPKLLEYPGHNFSQGSQGTTSIRRGRKNFIANRSISASPISLKLLIHKKHKKVLFTEAGKDFADFLFTLMSLPVSTPSSYSYSGEVCYLADDPKAICPKCHNFISKPTTYVAQLAIATSGKEGGFVREAVTYMITDDMEVKPMSAISSIALLQNFDVRDVRSLEEIVVPLDKDKKSSWQSAPSGPGGFYLACFSCWARRWSSRH